MMMPKPTIRTFFTVFIVAALSFLGVSQAAYADPSPRLLSPGEAQAAKTAYNTKTQWLSGRPNNSMPRSCVERPITLASGRYDFLQIVGNLHTPIRWDVHLGAGTYTWKDCLEPNDGYYTHTTLLIPNNPDWPLLHAINNVYSISTGDTTWGSYLDPRF